MQYLMKIVSYDEFDVKKVKELAGIFGEKLATRISLLKDLRVRSDHLDCREGNR